MIIKPIIDGIVDKETFYSEGNLKILWVLKEGNVAPEDHGKPRDICEELHNKEHLKNALSIPTFKKIIYSTYWLLNPEKEWSDIPYANEEECYSAVDHIGYININKYPAGAVSNDSFLYQEFNKNKETLLAQIDEINPELIIFGNTLKFFGDSLKEIGWDTNDKIIFDDNVDVYLTKKKGIIINAYHPAYFKIADKRYCESIKDAYLKYKEKV